MSGYRLSELSRAEAGERGRAGAVCLLPVGSLEQHGEHLPVGTDSLLVETVCLRAAGLARRDVVVAPTVWTGLSPHHVRLGVTVTLEPELLLELTRSIVALPAAVVRRGRDRQRPRRQPGLARRPRARRGVSLRQLLGPRRACAPARALSRRPRLDRPRRAGRDVGDAVGGAGARGRAASAAFEPIARENDPFLLPDMGASGVLGDPAAATAAAGRAVPRRGLHRARRAARRPSTSDPEENR